MKKTINRDAEIKELLISNTIRLISEGGFEKATTKSITHCGGTLPDFKMNEVYIYRLFGSKENLYEAAFFCLDTELYEAFMRAAEYIGGLYYSDKERIFEFLGCAWPFILKNEENCRCYVRYYYSVYFKGRSLEAHRKLFGTIVSQMSRAFKDEADAFAILHCAFTTLLNFGIRVYNGELEDNEINRSHIFNVIYCMMSTYFKSAETVS